jgi:tetraacyldisaccharide 4'-kinase
MQYRELHRDVEIIVLDTELSFSSFLPSGRRREEYYRLRCADLILFIGTPPTPALQARIALFTSAPQVIGESLPIGYFDLSGHPIDITLRDQKIGVFCGIGQPNRFMQTLAGEGAEIVYRHLLPDHGVATEATLQKIAREAQQQGAKYVVCTEKDRVKLSPQLTSVLPIIWLKITLQIVDNQNAWHNIIREIKQLVDRSLCHHRGNTKS